MQNFLKSAIDLAGFKYKTQVFCLCPASLTVICWVLGDVVVVVVPSIFLV
jgi:hypothetical protein